MVQNKLQGSALKGWRSVRSLFNYVDWFTLRSCDLGYIVIAMTDSSGKNLWANKGATPAFLETCLRGHDYVDSAVFGETWLVQDMVQSQRSRQTRSYIIRWRNHAGKVVYPAKQSYREAGVWHELLKNEAGKGNLVKAVKRIVRQGTKTLLETVGWRTPGENWSQIESEIREVWTCYFEKFLNEEFEWNRDFLKDWHRSLLSSTADALPSW